MRKVFLFMGQSNADKAQRIQLAPVPTWAQTAANGWTGAPTVSTDSGIEYPRPTASNSPSLYNANNTGLVSGVRDAWGNYDGYRQKPDGTYGEESTYGPETAFLAKYRADHPDDSLAVVKCVLGGSSITDWLTGSMLPIWQATVDQAAARLDASEGAGNWEWTALIWMQGENGASSVYPYLHPTPGQEYKDKLRAFLSLVRARTTPLLICGVGIISDTMLDPSVIGTHSSGEDTPENRTGATLNRRAQQDEVGNDPGNFSWLNDGYAIRPDNSNPLYRYHWSNGDYLASGERAYVAFAATQPPPPPPPPLVVKFNGVEKPDWSVALNGTGIGTDGDVIDVTGSA